MSTSLASTSSGIISFFCCKKLCLKKLIEEAVKIFILEWHRLALPQVDKVNHFFFFCFFFLWLDIWFFKWLDIARNNGFVAMFICGIDYNGALPVTFPFVPNNNICRLNTLWFCIWLKLVLVPAMILWGQVCVVIDIAGIYSNLEGISVTRTSS